MSCIALQLMQQRCQSKYSPVTETMIFDKFVLCFLSILLQNAAADPPNFRILAPPFICPNDPNSVIQKSDNTVITLVTDPDIELECQWTVRWYPLIAPTQQFTLALWRIVRHLEQELNDQPIESNVYIINNTELLSGVNYIFNVTATYPGEEEGAEQVFYIDNIKGDPTLSFEGRSDMFSIFLVGGHQTYADMDYVIEAQVTSCYRTQDYYFVWTLTSSRYHVAVWDIKGSRLDIRANTLTPGLSYKVLCQVYKYSNGDFITQNTLQFQVIHRDINTNFNIDILQLSINTPFSLYTDLTRLDYIEAGLTIAWECTLDGLSVDTYYRTDDEGTLIFPTGLPDVGEYLISLTVNVPGKSSADQAIARIITVETPLPLIQVIQNSRILNEGSVTTLKANVTNVTPGCSITWYFESETCLKSEFSTSTENCHVTKHGTPISTPVNFYSLEENFLSELTDYTNETGPKTVTSGLLANAGRARIVAECGCDEDKNCTSEGMVYADIYFQMNDKPKAGYVMITPGYGIAMETVFRVSTIAIVDSNGPLRYNFYCQLSKNDSILLESYVGHLAFETFLPYIDGTALVHAEVCDSLGACRPGSTTIISMSPGAARTFDMILEDARAHVKRCELMLLRRLAASAIVTYTNAGQTDVLTKFTSNLLNILGGIEEQCIEKNYDQYYEFLYWLQRAGIDTTMLV